MWLQDTRLSPSDSLTRKPHSCHRLRTRYTLQIAHLCYSTVRPGNRQNRTALCRYKISPLFFSKCTCRHSSSKLHCIRKSPRSCYSARSLHFFHWCCSSTFLCMHLTCSFPPLSRPSRVQVEQCTAPRTDSTQPYNLSMCQCYCTWYSWLIFLLRRSNVLCKLQICTPWHSNTSLHRCPLHGTATTRGSSCSSKWHTFRCSCSLCNRPTSLWFRNLM
jgi:hypothetical protein